jgi:hypothetical protein
MYSVVVCTTDDRELPAPELGGVNWERLTEILRREVSPDAANMFAEPIPDPARGQTHWHVTANDDPIAFSALSTPEREAVSEKLDQRGREIIAFADRLTAGGREADQRLAAVMRLITEVPDRERHIWSVDGKPVITAWGRRPLNAPERAGTIIIRERAPGAEPAGLSGTVTGTAPVLPPRLEAAAPPTPPPPIEPAKVERVAPAPRPRPAWMRILPLWALLAALMLGIFWALLPACSVSLPVLNRLFNHCGLDTATARDLSQLREQNQALRDAVRQAEMRVATVEGDCATQRRAGVDTPPNPQPNRNPTTPPDARETEERSRRAQGTEGKLDITLAWDGTEDLDIHVRCPGGEIWAENRNACGGLLEIDRNAKVGDRVEHPLEHVTWVTDPPTGEYEVLVRLYNRFDLAARDIPFTVVVREGNNRRDFTGSTREEKQMVSVARFRR